MSHRKHRITSIELGLIEARRMISLKIRELQEERGLHFPKITMSELRELFDRKNPAATGAEVGLARRQYDQPMNPVDRPGKTPFFQKLAKTLRDLSGKRGNKSQHLSGHSLHPSALWIEEAEPTSLYYLPCLPGRNLLPHKTSKPIQVGDSQPALSLRCNAGTCPFLISRDLSRSERTDKASPHRNQDTPQKTRSSSKKKTTARSLDKRSVPYSQAVKSAATGKPKRRSK